MRYWDSSARVACCLQQDATHSVKAILASDPLLVTAWFAPIECWSAFARLTRERVLTPESESQARDVLDSILSACLEVNATPALRLSAGRLVRVHPLRAADSIQLASALEWAESHPEGREFVCLDARLRECAIAEGFTVLP